MTIRALQVFRSQRWQSIPLRLTSTAARQRLRVEKVAFLVRQPGFPTRLLNYLSYRRQRGRVSRVSYKPVVVTIEPVRSCNLRCPGCVTGTLNPARRPSRVAPLSQMKAAIAEVAPWALQLQLYHWGEPFLNPDLLAACRFATSCGLWTSIHTNFSLPVSPEAIVASGLSALYVSCDGATQETYEVYRRGGDIALVFDNLAAVAMAKRRLRSRFPHLIAKFLVFEHNWHEMAAFASRARRAGADSVMFLPGFTDGVYENDQASAEREFHVSTLLRTRRRLPQGCPDLWESLIIDHDGGVFPCCYGYREQDLFGRPLADGASPILGFWNNDSYQRARSFFLSRTGRDDLPSPCNNCARTAR